MAKRPNDTKTIQSPLVHSELESFKFSKDDPNTVVVPSESPYFLKFQQHDDADVPIPQVTLRSWWFLLVVLSGIGIVAIVISFIMNGVVIEKGVRDTIGSTSNADKRVALYQTISGFFWAAVGLVLEQYFNIFLAVIVTFLANSPWYPYDRPREGNGRFKRIMLFWFPPLMMYLINIGLSSVYIEHKVTDQHRSFVDADLVATTSLSVSLLSAAKNSEELKSVVDTVLRSAVLKTVVPFEINADSKCSVGDLSKLASGKRQGKNGNSPSIPNADTLPGVVTNVVDIQSTSVAYAFPRKDWLLDAMPKALKPVASIEFSATNLSDKLEEMEKQYAGFLRENALDPLTMFEMMLQGLVQVDKAFSASNTDVTYPCGDVDGLPDTEEEVSGSSASDSETTPTGAETGNTTTRRRLASRGRALQTEEGASPLDGSSLADEVGLEAGSWEDMEDFYDDDEEYEFDDSDGYVVDNFQRFTNEATDGENFGKRKCFGAISSLSSAREASRDTLAGLFLSLSGYQATMDLNSSTIKLETYAISPHINFTSITIDLPFSIDLAYYAGTGNEELCDDNGNFRDPESIRAEVPDEETFIDLQMMYCDKTYYAIDGSSQCGSRNCVFKDESAAFSSKKQVTMTPYVSKCDPANITYDHNVYSWFPGGCVEQSDAAFLHGFGSYVAGNFDAIPGYGAQIMDVRRHYVFSFAKLTWRFEDLSPRFDAKCSVPGACDGMLHKLEKVSPSAPTSKKKAQVLMVGKEHFQTPHQNYSMQSPLILVSLNSPKFYYSGAARTNDTFSYFVWDNIDLKFLNTTYKESDGLGLEKGSCSLIIDSYLDQVNKNHYYISDPLQVLYTSAIYYLFQDAAVKEVELPSSNKVGVVDLSQTVIGSSRMKGDREKKEIKYSISLVSAGSTFIGIAILVVYSSIVLLVPRGRVKRSDGNNFATKYADVLIDDSYPERVHRRKLELPSGERIEMDEYGVESIKFVHEHDPDLKFTL